MTATISPTPDVVGQAPTPPTFAERVGRWLRRSGPALGLTAGALIIWQLVVDLAHISAFLLPSPLRIVEALVGGFASGAFLPHTLATLTEVLGGFGIAVVGAFAVALVVTKWAWLERAVMPIIVGLQTVPKLALAPLILTWFGFGLTSKLITTALVAFFPLLVNLITGLHSVDSERVDMFRAWNASEWAVFTRLRLPHALPYIFAGLDIAAVFAVIGAVVAEFVGAQEGLGYLIQLTTTSLDVATTFAALVVLSAIGMILHWIIEGVGHRVVFWQGRGHEAMQGV